MLWNLDPFWLMMAATLVAIVSCFLGSALNAVMSDGSFGPFGNAVILGSSFFLTILVANHYGYNLRDLNRAVVVGLAGAFVCMFSLTVARAIVARL